MVLKWICSIWKLASSLKMYLWKFRNLRGLQIECHTNQVHGTPSQRRAGGSSGKGLVAGSRECSECWSYSEPSRRNRELLGWENPSKALNTEMPPFVEEVSLLQVWGILEETVFSQLLGLWFFFFPHCFPIHSLQFAMRGRNTVRFRNIHTVLDRFLNWPLWLFLCVFIFLFAF